MTTGSLELPHLSLELPDLNLSELEPAAARLDPATGSLELPCRLFRLELATVRRAELPVPIF